MTVRAHPDTICLFDVDGTLTPARQTISKEMLTTLAELKKKCTVGFVGGSDLVKQEEQLGHGIFYRSLIPTIYTARWPETFRLHVCRERFGCLQGRQVVVFGEFHQLDWRDEVPTFG